ARRAGRRAVARRRRRAIGRGDVPLLLSRSGPRAARGGDPRRGVAGCRDLGLACAHAGVARVRAHEHHRRERLRAADRRALPRDVRATARRARLSRSRADHAIQWRRLLGAGGALALGPQSAGAAPGPVCYGLDGTEPTVTDANVVLGRIDGSRFLGGTMPLDAAGAARAVDERLAPRLGLSRASAAAGVVRLADVKMALAVRGI